MIKITLVDINNEKETVKIVDSVKYFQESGGLTLDTVISTNGMLSQVEREFISFDDFIMVAMESVNKEEQE